MKDFRTNFGDFLASEGITQLEASKKLGVTQQAISSMLDPNNDKTVRPSTQRKVLAAYPEFAAYKGTDVRSDLGTLAADRFEELMRESAYFRSKVEAYGKQMVIDHLTGNTGGNTSEKN